ncbi:21247_t:CDS:2, partial [Dentiscutata erythropus]
EYVNAVKHLISISEVRVYMEMRVLVVLMDYSDQLHVCRGITHRIKSEDSSRIPEQILHIIPMIGPLHVSLNSRETFEHSKDPEVRYLINLLDNIVLLVLDFYPIIFHSGNWQAYIEAMFCVWAIFYQYQQKHYNKLLLTFLSDVFFWISTNHSISQALVGSLHVFNDYFVENFHSSLRQQIQESNTADQIIIEL